MTRVINNKFRLRAKARWSELDFLLGSSPCSESFPSSVFLCRGSFRVWSLVRLFSFSWWKFRHFSDCFHLLSVRTSGWTMESSLHRIRDSFQVIYSSLSRQIIDLDLKLTFLFTKNFFVAFKTLETFPAGNFHFSSNHYFIIFTFVFAKTLAFNPIWVKKNIFRIFSRTFFLLRLFPMSYKTKINLWWCVGDGSHKAEPRLAWYPLGIQRDIWTWNIEA